MQAPIFLIAAFENDLFQLLWARSLTVWVTDLHCNNNSLTDQEDIIHKRWIILRAVAYVA